MPYNQEQLKEKYLALPKDVQDAIFSVDSSEAIRAIGEKHKLMIDKIGLLADETGLVMVGATHPKDFISNLSSRLQIDKETAKEIAADINARIFAPVRESLKKIHGLTEEIAEEEPEKPKPEKEPPPTSAPAAAEPLDLTREEVLRAIEKPETAGMEKTEKPSVIPEFLKGTAGPDMEKPEGETEAQLPKPSGIFENKMEPGISRNQSQTTTIEQEEKEKKPTNKRYPEKDPYREPIE